MTPLGTYLHGSATPGLRGAMLLGLSETGTPQTLTSTTDAGGGATQAWVNRTAIPCRIDPMGSGQGPTTGGRLDERSTHLVTVPPRTTINLTDRFVITARGTFEVTAVHQETDGAATVFEVVQI
jgi:head-tail adaptor